MSPRVFDCLLGFTKICRIRKSVRLDRLRLSLSQIFQSLLAAFPIKCSPLLGSHRLCQLIVVIANRPHHGDRIKCLLRFHRWSPLLVTNVLLRMLCGAFSTQARRQRPQALDRHFASERDDQVEKRRTARSGGQGVAGRVDQGTGFFAG
jgi:hypothetical protein